MDSQETTTATGQGNLASLLVSRGERVDYDVIGRVFEDLVPAIVEVMSSFFEAPCGIKLASFREDSFQAVCSDASCLISEIRLPDEEEPVVIVLPYQTVFALIGVMFGEDDNAPPYTPTRALTSIEVDAGGEVAKALVGALFQKEEWLKQLEPNADTVQSLDWSGDEVEYDTLMTRIFAAFQITLGNRNPTALYIGCPANTARELQNAWIDQNSSTELSVHAQPNAYWSQQIKKHVDGASVEIVASVTCPDTTLGVIAGLKPGSILEINQTNDSLVTLECDAHPIFRGSLGKSSGSFAVEVEATVDHWGEFLCELLVESDEANETTA